MSKRFPAADKLYIRNETSDYKYSVKFTNSKGQSEWANAELELDEIVDGKLYYFYSIPTSSDYTHASIYVYKPSQEQGQNTDYHLCLEDIALNQGYDTVSLKYKGSSLSYRFINMTYNTDEGEMLGEFSSKGIKAGNSVTIWGGKISISSHGDGIRANNDTALQNGSTATGNITINGGTVNIKTYGTAIRADGSLTITNGKTTTTKCYVGLEGKFIKLTGGLTSVEAIAQPLFSTTEDGISIADGTYRTK